MFEKYYKAQPIMSIVGNNSGVLINQHGTLYDRFYVEMPCALNSVGEPVIEIEFLDEFKVHRIIDLVACHFKLLIPTPILLRNIEGFPIDGDKLNTHASNVAYRLIKFPLEHPEVPGYFYIPGYPRLLINKDGQILNEVTKRELTWGITKPPKHNPKNITGGYFATVASIDTIRIGIGRHRAMLLAFKPIPDDIESLVANHVDGIPGNDTLDNLEWVSRKRNLTHAYEENLRTQNKPVYVRHIVTGEVTEHHSVEEGARCTNSSGALFNLMLNELEFGYFNQKGYQVKYQDDQRDWVDIEDPRQALIAKQQAVPVRVRDCKTLKESVYESTSQASACTGVLGSTISLRLNKKDYSPCFGFQFIHLEDTFPDFTKEEYEQSLVASSFKVDARNFLTGAKDTYDSVALAEKAHGHTNVSGVLRDGRQPKFSDGWTYKLSEDDWDVIEDPVELAYQLTIPVTAKNIVTGEYIYASSIRDIVRQLKLDTKVIRKRLNTKGKVPHGDYLFIKGVDLSLFADVNKETLKPFIVTDTDNKDHYCTTEEAVNLTGCSEVTLYRRTRQNRNDLPNGMVVSRNNSNN